MPESNAYQRERRLRDWVHSEQPWRQGIVWQRMLDVLLVIRDNRRLRAALAESCDENRSVALAEPGRTHTCPLIDVTEPAHIVPSEVGDG